MPNLTPEAKAAPTQGPWTAQLHHTRDYAGRTHGFITAGSAVPLAAVVLGVEGGSQAEGRANLRLIVRLANLYFAGVKFTEDQAAAIRARGDLPPDLSYGLTENEVAAGRMMNGLMVENEVLRVAMAPFVKMAAEFADERREEGRVMCHGGTDLMLSDFRRAAALAQVGE